MVAYRLDPIQDPRWTTLVNEHPRSSIFHTRGWLQALRDTYRYEPVAITTSDPTAVLANGVVFCHVASWITGQRMVSLPFADHCEPLVSSDSELHCILSSKHCDLGATGSQYIELRPLSYSPQLPELTPVADYHFHCIDLRSNLTELYSHLHKSSVQRKIKRAKQEQVTQRSGASEELLSQFYALLTFTRKRQRTLIQPIEWYLNLVKYLRDALQIRIAYKNSLPIAAIIVLRFRNTVVYKYGASDRGLANLGAMPFLFWKLMQEAKGDGVDELDMGRSDHDAIGLSTFKRRCGATESRITYWRQGTGPVASFSGTRMGRIARQVVAHLPSQVFTRCGSLLYRHIG